MEKYKEQREREEQKQKNEMRTLTYSYGKQKKTQFSSNFSMVYERREGIFIFCVCVSATQLFFSFILSLQKVHFQTKRKKVFQFHFPFSPIFTLVAFFYMCLIKITRGQTKKRRRREGMRGKFLRTHICWAKIKQKKILCVWRLGDSPVFSRDFSTHFSCHSLLTLSLSYQSEIMENFSLQLLTSQHTQDAKLSFFFFFPFLLFKLNDKSTRKKKLSRDGELREFENVIEE